jgi:predicted nucleic acid-binding protein
LEKLKVIVDAQVLFYFHYRKEKIPPLLADLKSQIIKGQITAIIPVVAIAELFYKARKRSDVDTEDQIHERVLRVQIAVQRWKRAENVIIDYFDEEILDFLLQNDEYNEIFDELIALSCKRHQTNIIYTRDRKFETVFKLEIRPWK